MPDLFRVQIISNLEDSDLITGVLSGIVKHGWEEEETPEGVIFSVHSEQPEFGQELEISLLSILPSLKIRHSTVPDVDWVSSWKEFFVPVLAGTRFIVLPPWLDDDIKNTKRIPIIIEPKTAFGTGHHATTALCLTAISDLFDKGLLKAGQNFLDLGTGSGILGIGAALLGLTGVGVDLDMLAVSNALENREINGIKADDFKVSRGSMEAVSTAPFDIVLANILAEPLINLSSAITSSIKSGGALILSGILTVQAEKVESVYMELGLPKALHLSQDEWTCLVWENVVR